MNLSALAIIFGGTGFAAEPVPLQVLEPRERAYPVRDWPVSVGIIFPQGELSSVPGGAVVDDRGRSIPFDAEATGWWEPEKRNVKWLLVRFRADSDRSYFFLPGEKPQKLEGAPLASQGGDTVTVETGPLRVLFRNGRGRIFDEVFLNGRAMLARESGEQKLTLTFPEHTTEMKDWVVEVEENTPLRAVVRGRGHFGISWQEKVARVDVRYEFFKGESFVRIYHTLTWMIRNPKIGAREFSVGFKPEMGERGSVRVGLSEYSDDAFGTEWSVKDEIYVHQDGPEHFSIEQNGKVSHEGKQLGGWIGLEGGEGRGVGVALRDTWQMFPTAFSVKDGGLHVEFWPSRGEPMGLMPEDIMPPDFFNKADYWNRFQWVQKKGHFVHEYSSNPYYVHTAEGAARTHEMVIHFYDKSSHRSTSQLNSLTQHPMVVRQDPKLAMRVPFLGMEIEPVRKEYPDIEHALHQLGRLSMGRWAKTHDYGFWRYGMTRWEGTGVSYRWIDGVQYDQQMIPWLLYMRGGDRRWLEEGETTARFAMDVSTNHYNTRGLPTGYQASAQGMPFPWYFGWPKIDFLYYCYHLTGYKRAKEVMEEVIAGYKARFGKAYSDKANPHRGGHARDLFNMNAFWVLAYEETWDPEIKELAREFLSLTLDREYNHELNSFRSPEAFLFPQLILQYELWKDERAKKIMLRYLAGDGLANLDLPNGGVGLLLGCMAGWGYSVTGDRRFAQIGWDIARTVADTIPDHDWSSPEVPPYPTIYGSQMYLRMLCIIGGYSLGARLGMKMTDPFALKDVFLGLTPVAEGKARAEIFLKPRSDGDLPVRLTFIGIWNQPVEQMQIAAFDPSGGKILETTFTSSVDRKIPPDNFFPRDWFLRGLSCSITLPNAKRGAIHRLVIEGSNKNNPMVLPVANADMVQRVGGLVFLYTLAGQYPVGARLFTRSVDDTITIASPYGRHFAIRDAETSELFYRSTLTQRETPPLKVGKGRPLQITTYGGPIDGMVFKGMSPYFARTREEWFDPTAMSSH